MTEYKHSRELEGKTLKYGDRLVFQIGKEILDYFVDNMYLYGIVSANDIIFQKLELHKISFCKKSYGYMPVNETDNVTKTHFPECKLNDYEALTRVAIALFKECEKRIQPKFKLGDKVRLLGTKSIIGYCGWDRFSSQTGLKKGDIGIIEDIENNYVWIRFLEKSPWYFAFEDIELEQLIPNKEEITAADVRSGLNKVYAVSLAEGYKGEPKMEELKQLSKQAVADAQKQLDEEILKQETEAALYRLKQIKEIQSQIDAHQQKIKELKESMGLIKKSMVKN